jgi:hypothetical protein
VRLDTKIKKVESKLWFQKQVLEHLLLGHENAKWSKQLTQVTYRLNKGVCRSKDESVCEKTCETCR